MNAPDDKDRFLVRSSLLMKSIGWGFFPLSLVVGLAYPPGFLWGLHHGGEWSPYVFMMLGLYLAWCILLIREARHPEKAVLLFDWGILANTFHAIIMTVQAVFLDHEHAHLWGDVPALFGMVFLLWYYSPRRIASAPEKQ